MSTPSLAEQDLIRRTQEGNQDAAAQLFQMYRARLRRMVDLRMHSKVRSRLDASDVLQEALVEVLRQIPKLTEKKEVMTPFTWMRLITGSRLKQIHRRHLGTDKRDAQLEISLVQQAVPLASSVFLANQLAGQFTSVDRNLRKEDAVGKLEEILNDMDQSDREIIAMRHFEELTTEEIAAELDMTRSGVLKRYGRAIRRLTDVMGDPSQFGI